ncbi:type II secretion system F family protein [Algisphaera agarilytica]|uniref:Type II secretory pathway component PulF n=1 Tax=Algisphaera agarilytica TaxID=1385975 RepID=A0A7X0H4R7_9BACT|nr:type II secretion system F family protein [Algisphaera agarilytica]MBB6429251.1 type II secretory pathway component PulF [Algisphaera agarilytica]
MPTTISTARRAKPTAKPSKADRGPRLSLSARYHRQRNLLFVARQMQVLLASGTPVVSVLEGIERQTKDELWRDAIAGVRRSVEEGANLSAAMAQYPHLFDRVFRSLIEAGETAGKLPEMLDRLVKLTQKDIQMRSGILGALLYPAILLTVVVVVLCITLIVVVPRFTLLFESLSVPIPPTTQATVFASEVLRGYWWAVLTVLIGGGVGLFFWLRTDGGQQALHTLAIRMPIIGKLTQSFVTARIVRLLGVLMNSHLPLLQTLELVKASAGNRHYAALITRAEQAVGQGEPVSSAFNNPELITPSVYEAFRSGEASGRIAPSLITVADFLEEENDVIVRSLTKILEPLILIVLGGMVGLLAVSMFMPLFDLTAMAGGGQ